MSELKSPKILTSNNLLNGRAVFLTATGWQFDIDQAEVVKTEEELEQLNSKAQDSFDTNEIVEFYAIDVQTTEGGDIEPVAIREKIRVSGPTIDYHPTI